ncbi:PadR family transcriptional regulator [Microbacterium sp. LRZ72]|nr:PadR family transcriptional regulator [Microbacterium sp. LRZ72]
MTRGGFLKRVRLGREIGFSLSDDAAVVLREAAERVHAQRPFDPKGSGWTLVTFSVPEAQRRVRHRLRSSLSWEGFAPLRDGLWLAAGEVNLDAALEPLADALVPHAVTAFRAVDLPAYPVSRSVREAWDVDAIRAEHEEFISTWSRDSIRCLSELSEFVCLIADWLSLLRSDPCLPPEFLEQSWPSERSVALYHLRRAQLATAARAQFSAAADRPRELVED